MIAARLFKIDNLDSSSSTSASYPAFLSAIARQGSGSACRSMYGGFVKWQKGNGGAAGYDGSDSHAIQVEERAHWPDLDMLILVANAKKKKVSSSSGMQTTAATSPLLAHRAQNIVAPRLAEMEKACKERDFDTFARLTMMDSNQFHATWSVIQEFNVREVFSHGPPFDFLVMTLAWTPIHLSSTSAKCLTPSLHLSMRTTSGVKPREKVGKAVLVHGNTCAPPTRLTPARTLCFSRAKSTSTSCWRWCCTSSPRTPRRRAPL